MKYAVVGAGAWGLPAAAQLARRGHNVTLVDAFDVGHPYGSSSGDTRLWRLSHTEPFMVRLALRAVEAWRRLESDVGVELLLQRGLLWRGDSAVDVAKALAAEGVEFTGVSSSEVGEWFPGLRDDGRDAVWQETAGPVLAAASLQAHLTLLKYSGGVSFGQTRLVALERTPAGVQLQLQHADGSVEILEADVVVLALGPWAKAFLPLLGVDVDLNPVLEQVSYFGPRAGAATSLGVAQLPCFYDGPTDTEPGLYAMPVPGVGYKLGLDHPVGVFDPRDLQRSPSAERTADIEGRVARDFAVLDPTAVRSMVCTWTDSPDGRFIIDQLWDGHVVLACGDSGTGFKFSALMGEVLADLAEGRTPDADVAAFGLVRLQNPSLDTSVRRHLQ